MFKDIPNNWKLSYLKDVGKIETGNTPSKSNSEYYETNDILWVKPSDLNEWKPIISKTEEMLSEKARKVVRIIPTNSVLVSCIGSIGKLGIASKELATNQQINSIIFDEQKIKYKYGYYALKFAKKRLESIASRAVVPIINKTQFSTFSIPIPQSLEEQEEIVKILDCASEIIRLRKECIKDAQNLIPAIFQEMFGDVTDNKKNYPQTTLKTVANVNPEKNILKDNENVSFLAMKDVSEYGQIDLSTVKQYKDVKVGYTSFKDDDILLAKITPCFENGKAAIAKKLVGGYGFGSTEFYILRPNKNKILPEYLYSVVKSNRFANIGKLNMKGAAGQKRLTKDFVNNYQFLLPSIKEQELFAQKVQEIEEYIKEQQEELKNLEDMFQSLLHHAFTGELTRRAYGEN